MPEGFCDLIDVFHGEMTCCSLGHRKGTVTCDREKLVKPMLGLLVELYRDRHDDPAARAIWDAIEPNLSRLYPKRFEYAVGKSGKTERSRASNVAWYARWLRQSNKPINDCTVA